MNFLAYADDLVLLVPSWRALQTLISVAEFAACNITMTFNTKETVCMIFDPTNKKCCVTDTLLTAFIRNTGAENK